MVLLCLLVLTASGSVRANPPRGYIGLFADEDHSSWCASGAPVYPVEIWVMCLPGYLGQICAEFAVHYPANVTQSTITINSALWFQIPGYLCVDDYCNFAPCYHWCEWDWHWVMHQTIYVTDWTPSFVEITGNQIGGGTYQFANCDSGYPLEPCTVLTRFYLNYDPSAPECMATATKSESWGAIKSLVR
jgi:hypothetical protein